jgi:hypothetical protein
MSTMNYSTRCYVKNELYCVSIVGNVNNDHAKQSDLSNTEIIECLSSDIPIASIETATVRIEFDLIDGNKPASIVPKTIDLHRLLTIELNDTLSNPEQTSTNIDANNPSVISMLPDEPCQQTCETTISTSTCDKSISTASVTHRRFTFKSFISSLFSAKTSVNLNTKSIIKLCYVNVCESVRWNINRLDLHFETNKLAEDFSRNINLCLSTFIQRPHHLLVFINPLSGKGRLDIFESNMIASMT